MARRCWRRRSRGLVLSAMAALLWATPGAAASWQVAAAEVESHLEQTEKARQALRDSMKKEKEELLARLEELEARVEEAEALWREEQGTLDALLEEERSLESRMAEEEGELQLLEGILQGAARDARALLEASPFSAGSPERLEPLDPLLDGDASPSFVHVKGMLDLLLDEMEASGRVRLAEGDFVNEQGREAAGEILQVGPFTSIYRQGDDVGLLRYRPGELLYESVPRPSWLVRRSIRKYLEGESRVLPVDLSGGAVFESASQGKDVREWLRSGGFLVWPILLVGLAAVVLSLERVFFFIRHRKDTDKLMGRIEQLAFRRRWQDCRDLPGWRSKCPTCRVLRAGLDHLGATRESLENGLQEAVLKELPRVERFLSTLSVLAAVAPLLGLLGTVTGMINTFRVITVYGTGDPRMMSGGISEALVTTQLGLAVAIPIVLAHHFLERRAEKILGDMEEKGTALTATLLKHGGLRDGVAHRAA